MLGASESAIARRLADDRRPIEVLSWNREIVAVFLLCRMEVQFSMAGKHVCGVSAVEVETVCRCLKVNFDAEMLHGIRVMAGAFAGITDKRIAEQAKQRERARPSRPRRR